MCSSCGLNKGNQAPAAQHNITTGQYGMFVNFCLKSGHGSGLRYHTYAGDEIAIITTAGPRVTEMTQKHALGL